MSNDAIEVQPLTLHIGAEISGVDLSQPLSDAQRTAINGAFLKWKVVFFRGQNLDHAAHVAFARQMGEPTIGHAVFGHIEEFPEIYSVAKFRTAQVNPAMKMAKPWTGWHTDITAAVNPPMASILRGVDIPPYGGDTLWTNLAVAYQGLSEPMRGIIDNLRGIHRFQAAADTGNAAYNERVKKRELETEHPLVTVHPETGERQLYVSPSFLKSIVGLSPRESEKFLELLWEHVVRTEYTVRFKWQPGDIAMWDNRATAHLAPTDIFASEFDRQLYRITLVGQVPTGIDGKPSVSLKGQPILAVETELSAAAS
ncbi:MAG: alpha-ketoglutarate-dependent taurine dioxygenase [Hyphomicrobiaceae bacterium]|jgi:alpha-ketoglutarate-dependent taurine dioxygenase